MLNADHFSIICLLFWDLATNLLDSLVTLSVNTSVSSVKCISSWLIFFFLKKVLLLPYPGRFFFVTCADSFLTIRFGAINRKLSVALLENVSSKLYWSIYCFLWGVQYPGAFWVWELPSAWISGLNCYCGYLLLNPTLYEIVLSFMQYLTSVSMFKKF